MSSNYRYYCERRSLAVALRRIKYTYEEVGEALGVSTERARQIILHAPKIPKVVDPGVSDRLLPIDVAVLARVPQIQDVLDVVAAVYPK